jgi:hypothetical protein
LKNARKQRNEERRMKEALYPCFHKIKYKGVKVALENMKKESIKRNKTLWIYKCEFCHYWHLTSSPPRF